MVFPFTAQPFVVFLTNISPQHLEGIIHSSSAKKALVERAVVGLLRLSPRLLHREELAPQVFTSIQCLLKMNEVTLGEVAPQIAAGVCALLKSNISDIRDPAQWTVILQLLTVSMESGGASLNTMLAVLFIVSNSQTFDFREGPFSELVGLLLKFVSTSGVRPGLTPSLSNLDLTEPLLQPVMSDLFGTNVDITTRIGRGVKAISVLYYLHTQVWATLPRQQSFLFNPAISPACQVLVFTSKTTTGKGTQQPVEILWGEYWLPLLSGLGSNCCHPVPDIRQAAFIHLSQGLLLSELNSSLTPKEFSQCFEKILFPSLDDLLNPDVYRADPKGIDTARVQMFSLVSKIFLQYLTELKKSPSFSSLWPGILDFVAKYMKTDDSENLVGDALRQITFLFVFVCELSVLFVCFYLLLFLQRESVPEMLKNLLLVMVASGVLVDPISPHARIKDPFPDSGIALWELTWNKVSAVLPGMKEELFPAPQHL